MFSAAPSSFRIRHKRKLPLSSCVAQLITVLILSFLLHSNEAGIIKKREATAAAKENGNTESDIRETEMEPTILMPLNSGNGMFSTQLQSINDQNFATQTSKEVTNNEILNNEARQILAENAIKGTNNETLFKIKRAEETYNNNNNNNNNNKEELARNVSYKEQKSLESLQTTTEFSSNAIKEEKFAKFVDGQLESSLKSNNEDLEDSKNSSSLENASSIEDKNSKFHKGISRETEQPLTESKVQNKSMAADNSENSQEYIKNEVKLDSRDKAITVEPLVEFTTLKYFNEAGKSGDEKQVFLSKTLEALEESKYNSLERATSVVGSSGSFQALPTSTTVPLKVPDKGNQIESLAEQRESNQIYDQEAVENQAAVPTTAAAFPNLDETTLKSITKKDLLLSEGTQREHARSMFRKATTMLSIVDEEVDEALTEVTTFIPSILSLTNGIEETKKKEEKLKDQITDSTKITLPTSSAKAKKPKFINDNSTNAQQLNLPNMAEVWSLAAMRSLPKANITMETAQAPNQTHKEPNEVYNASSTVNSNSEKNLLDWSQIMMDKELSSTARNADVVNIKQKEVAANEMDLQVETEGKDLTTLIPESKAATLFTTNIPTIEVITQNSLIEQEITTSTISPAAMTSTILSSSLLHYKENDNDDKGNQADKKVDDNLNNHIDTLTATLATTVAANVDSNPFNTSLNIEPNLNEINLTSNQTQADLNNDVHSKTTTDGKKSINDDDVNADTYMETTTAAATPTTTTTATTATTATTVTTTTTAKTKATAVFDSTRVEQISSETTTVSTLETGKQNVSLSNGVISEQQENNYKSNNVINNEATNNSLSASHNELENTVVDSQNSITPHQYQNIDLTTQATTIRTTSTTAVPITTFRPTILAITSTTSTPATFEQEVDQNGNEIQTNLTNTHTHQSIIRTDLLQQINHSTKAITETHLKEIDFETTTLQTLTTTPATTQLTTNKIEDTLTSALENETTATTSSSSRDEQINETTELNIIASEATTQTTTQTTPKQVHERNNTGEEGEESKAITGSAVSEDKKFEKESETTTATGGINLSLNATTETPVVIDTEGGKELIERIIPTTAATTAATKAATTTTTATVTATASSTSSSNKQESVTEENVLTKEDDQTERGTTTEQNMNNSQELTKSTTSMPATAVKEEEEGDDATTTRTTTTTAQVYTTTISESHAPTTTTTTTTTLSPASSSSTLPSAVTTKVEEIYNVINSTTTELIETTTEHLITEIVEESSTDPNSSTSTTAITTEMLPPPAATTTQSSEIIGTADIGKSLPTLTSIMGGNSGNMYPKNSQGSGETDVNVIIAITVSVIGVVALVLLVGFLYLMRKRQKQTSYSQRCRPVSLDEYTIDNASVSGSMRKSSALRASKRTYGNLAFDDPALRPNPMGVQDLGKFVQEKLRIFEEFRDVPQITSRLDEVPTGCEDKNRYANVLPLPETRVILQRLNDDEKSEYINANYVTGPKDPPNYYIACQAPLESTVEDFWRMIWEQQSRVIIQATDLIENGVEKCAEYLPPSVTLDNHSSFGDFQITLQNREVKDKYAISTLLLKHVGENATRELTHYWYKWPEVGVPSEEAPIIAMLLEARSSLISYAIEQANEDKEKLSTDTLKSAEEGTATATATATTLNSNASSANGNNTEINGNISMVHIKKAARNQGPLTIHCSPGTGRTGTIIACDIAIRSLETPKRIVDIPQIVYYVRRGRASAVLTKEQYEFIYKVANMYAAKITNPTNYN